MKTFERKQKVYHICKGEGIVEKLKNNDTQGWIVFKNSGQGQWFRADDKSIQRGVNTYTPKQTPEAIEVLVEVQKLQMIYKKEVDKICAMNNPSDSTVLMGSTLNNVVNDLENILQGTNK